MSIGYKAVLWNRQKKIYDRVLWTVIVGLAILISLLQILLHPAITAETLIIRTTSIIAFLLLHFILAIGPICRLDKRYLPLLYNRRHLGVSMFIIALVHGVFSIIQFHGLGDTNPILSVFTSNQQYASISEFPFQILGFFALLILFLMAATSHDFWLKNLGPKVWKTLHMSVYLAYALLVAHVATGALQYESHPVYWGLLILGFVLLSTLHIMAGIQENKRIRTRKALEKQGFYSIISISNIDDNKGFSFVLNGENIAIFKYESQVSAVSNICKHQMGPLGEGKIIDGCITCPWHGYQYLPANGKSPPPFDEKLKTYAVKVEDDTIWVNPKPQAEGTFIEPAKV